MNLDVVLKFISKFRSLFSYLIGYFTGSKIERMTTEQKRLKAEAKRNDELYEVLRYLDLERHKRRLEYDRVRKERGDKPYIIEL